MEMLCYQTGQLINGVQFRGSASRVVNLKKFGGSAHFSSIRILQPANLKFEFFNPIKPPPGSSLTQHGILFRCLVTSAAKKSSFLHQEFDMESKPRGAFIVLEGIDRCGKTSQCNRLLSHLKSSGKSVESWRFPDRNTGVGQMISSYLANKSDLDDRAIHLLFSANRWEKRWLMESKLMDGTTLIVDRYSFSGVAFSSAKGLDLEWCKAPEAGLIAPDLVLYLDISPEKASERGGYGGERYEHLEFQQKVASSYTKLWDPTWKTLDASLGVEEVESLLKEVVDDCVMMCQKESLFLKCGVTKLCSTSYLSCNVLYLILLLFSFCCL